MRRITAALQVYARFPSLNDNTRGSFRFSSEVPLPVDSVSLREANEYRLDFGARAEREHKSDRYAADQVSGRFAIGGHFLPCVERRQVQ